MVFGINAGVNTLVVKTVDVTITFTFFWRVNFVTFFLGLLSYIFVSKKKRLIQYYINFDFCHIWLGLVAFTPLWHDGRGPYFSIGFGPIRVGRGY